LNIEDAKTFKEEIATL